MWTNNERDYQTSKYKIILTKFESLFCIFLLHLNTIIIFSPSQHIPVHHHLHSLPLSLSIQLLFVLPPPFLTSKSPFSLTLSTFHFFVPNFLYLFPWIHPANFCCLPYLLFPQLFFLDYTTSSVPTPLLFFFYIFPTPFLPSWLGL